MTDGPVTPPPLPPTPPAPPQPTPPPMAPLPPGGQSSNLVNRAIAILTRPAAEWRVIDGEATSVGRLIGGYAAILALIAPLAMLLGVLISPIGGYIFQMMGVLIKILLISYLVSFGTGVLIGFIIDLLAPNMGGTKNPVQAMKLGVYSATPFFLAALILILPDLWWLWGLIGIGYGGYLLWLGLPVLMRVPADKAPVFAGAVIGIWAVLFIVLWQIGLRIMYGGMYGGMM